MQTVAVVKVTLTETRQQKEHKSFSLLLFAKLVLSSLMQPIVESNKACGVEKAMHFSESSSTPQGSHHGRFGETAPHSPRTGDIWADFWKIKPQMRSAEGGISDQEGQKDRNFRKKLLSARGMRMYSEIWINTTWSWLPPVWRLQGRVFSSSPAYSMDLQEHLKILTV